MVCERSDMGNVSHMQRYFDDSVDAGFAIESKRTGNRINVLCKSVHFTGKGEDRELSHWDYIVLHELNRHLLPTQFEAIKDLTVRVYND